MFTACKPGPAKGWLVIRRWPTIPFGRLLGYSLMLASPTVLALDTLVFMRDLNIDHAIWVVASAMVSAIAVAWLFLGELAGMSRYTRQLAAGDEGELKDLRTEATRTVARQVAQLDGGWRRRVKAFSQSIDTDMQILESLSDPLILVDPDRHVVRANAAARALFGRSLAQEPIDTAIRPPQLLETVRSVLELRQPASLDLEWPGHFSRFFEARVMPVETVSTDHNPAEATGAPHAIAAVITLHETTETHRTAELRETFIANVSHELRTPLSVIAGFIETLMNLGEEDRDAQRRFLSIIHDQTNRMTRLVLDLLSLSRIDGHDHPPAEKVNLQQVVEEVAGAMELTAAARSISIDLDLEEGLDICGDYDRLCQVVQNLLDNAVKYGAEGGRVGIVGRRDADHIVLCVSDDGEGIPAEHIPHLGERFYRIDRARSRASGGSGLGLAIVSGIVGRHGGTLSVESRPGEGSTFRVRFPTGRPSA